MKGIGMLRFTALAIVSLATVAVALAGSAEPARCKGSDPCRACSTCELCKYCNTGDGKTCGICSGKDGP